MAITFVGSNTQDSAAALALTFSIPGGAAQDDLMVAFVKQSENTTGREWDDDGGGGNGWVRLAYNRTTGGRDQETAIYWKIHDGSESNPTFTWASGVTSEPMSGSLLVYRGTDLATPIQDWGFAEAQNDANPPNPGVATTSTPATFVVFHAATHDDISSVAAPTGYALRTQVWSGTANDHRNHFTADLIGSSTLGAYTPPDWQHGVLNSTPEYHTYTLALQEPVLIAATDFNTTEQFAWGDTDLVVAGFGFGATQGTGKVELWSDTSGTLKTVQTADSWSDTSLQIDTVQGALANDTTLYLVVTNDNGDESAPLAVTVGVVPYHEALLALIPDHYWRLNNVYDDTGITGPTRNMTSAVVGTWAFGSAPICDGNTHTLNYTSVTNRREIADSPNMNITISSQERTIAFWFQMNNVQHPLASIWKEGGGAQNLAFLIGYGNVLLAQLADVAGTRDNVQAWSDIRLTPGRPYHCCMRYSHLDGVAEMRLFLDGEEQANTDGNPMTIGIFDSHSGDVTWGDPDNNLETGGTDVSYNGPSDALISDFATWSDNSAGANAGGLDKVAEIRDVLFRRGANAYDQILSGAQSAMQAALDATADLRPDWPLSYRVEPVAGGGDLELVMNGKQFDARITLHLEYRGTDALTVVRPSSSNFDLSKAWSPSGGVINVVDLVDLTLTVRDIDSDALIEGARVRLLADSGGPETEGAVLLEGLTDANGELVGAYRFSSDQPITGRVRKGSSDPYYKTAGIAGAITSAGAKLTVFMIRDQ